MLLHTRCVSSATSWILDVTQLHSPFIQLDVNKFILIASEYSSKQSTAITMSAPSSDPPAQPPTEGNNEKHESTETSATAPAADAAPTSTDDVEMKQEEEKVDRFEDVPQHVLEVGRNAFSGPYAKLMLRCS